MRLRHLVLTACLPLLAGCSSSPASPDDPGATGAGPPSTEPDPRAPFDQGALDDLVRADVAAATSIDGELVAVLAPGRSVDLTSAVGVTAPGSTEELGPDATFRISSVTKAFTAAAVWRLVETGQLDVEAPLPGSGVPAPLVELLRDDGYDVDRMTVRQLLNHSSGLADHADNEAGASTGAYAAAVLADPGRTWTPFDQVRFAVDEHDPVAAPGVGFHYSDTGYVLLGQLLAARTGTTFAGALRSLLDLDGLELDATHLESVEPIPAGAGPRAAQRVGDVALDDVSPTVDLHGGGGLVSSAADVATFFRALGRNEVFERPDTFAAMSTAVAPGTRGVAAAGVYRTVLDGHECWSHDGFTGVQAITCPAIDLTIARSWGQAELGDGFAPDALLLGILDAMGVDEPGDPETATAETAETLLDRPVPTTAEPCPDGLPATARCGTAAVPLDWAATDGPTIDVWFGHQPGRAPSVGTVIPLLGGPGGAVSTALADFQPVADALPDRDVLFVDIRGVGRSGRLACPSIDDAPVRFGAEQLAANADCADAIGPARDSYRTVAAVLDLEAVRRTLDLPPPSLLAFSYGTYLATTYTVLFPEVVGAAVLDGGVPLDQEVWGRAAVSSIGPVARRVCARTAACDPEAIVDDLRVVALGLADDPAPIPGEDQRLTEGLLAYLAQAYLPQGDRTFLAAIGSAARGDRSALVELARPAVGVQPSDPLGDAFGLGAAVICNDYVFPYDLAAPPAERRAAFEEGLADLPADVFDPFSKDGWVEASWDHPDECLSWPVVDAPVSLRVPVDGPFPDVPVLVLNGDLDLQTPLSSALATTAQLPEAVLVEIVNGPHAVIPSSGCALRTALAFLDTAVLPAADVCAAEPVALPTG